MPLRFVFDGKRKRNAWLAQLDSLAEAAAIDAELDQLAAADTVRRLSFHFGNDEKVVDRILLTLSAIGGRDAARAQQLAYAGAAAAKPDSVADRRLSASWNDLSSQCLSESDLYRAFWKAACFAPKGSALKAHGLAGYEARSRAYLKLIQAGPEFPAGDECEDQDTRPSSFGERLADVFARQAKDAVRQGPEAAEAESRAAKFFGLALSRLDPETAREKASAVLSDCTGAFVGDTLRSLKEAPFGYHAPQQCSLALMRVAEEVLRL